MTIKMPIFPPYNNYQQTYFNMALYYAIKNHDEETFLYFLELINCEQIFTQGGGKFQIVVSAAAEGENITFTTI